MPKSVSRVASGAVVIAWLAATLTSCQAGDRGSALSPQIDEQLSDKISEAVAGRERVLLRDLTDFEWLTVSVFAETSTSAQIMREVGRGLSGGERYIQSSYLLVFCDGNQIVHAVKYPYDNLFPLRLTYSNGLEVGGSLVWKDGAQEPVTAACFRYTGGTGELMGLQAGSSRCAN